MSELRFAYTDYPFEELGDIAGKRAPIRRIEMLFYDQNKYVTIRVEGITTQIKSGYVYKKLGRHGEVENANFRDLPVEE